MNDTNFKAILLLEDHKLVWVAFIAVLGSDSV